MDNTTSLRRHVPVVIYLTCPSVARNGGESCSGRKISTTYSPHSVTVVQPEGTVETGNELAPSTSPCPTGVEMCQTEALVGSIASQTPDEKQHIWNSVSLLVKYNQLSIPRSSFQTTDISK